MTISKLRQDAIDIFKAGLKAVDPRTAVKKYMKRDGQTLIVDEKI